MRFYLFGLLLISFHAVSADVQVITNSAQGQGFLYEHDEQCFVITPSHVIEDATKISILSAARKSYQAKVVNEFDVDLSILEIQDANKLCAKTDFEQKTKLSSLLKIYDDGILRSKLSDGSTLQTKVNIDGVDEAEYLQITPKRESDILKQGYSGSVLYVADQPAGILLEVDEGQGFVYRSDALNEKLNAYFGLESAANPNKSEESSVTSIVGTVLSEQIAEGQELEWEFLAEENSPIEFIQEKSDERVQYLLEILDDREKVLFDDRLYAYRDAHFVFTPEKSGKYTLRLTGVKDAGSVSLKTTQWALDSELRGEGNVFEPGDEIANHLGPSAIAEYRFAGDANSPIEFIQEKSDERVQYLLEILDDREKVLFDDRLYAYRDAHFVFTPEKSGKYTLRLTGVKDAGSVSLKTTQWALDSELRGEGNVFEPGDEIANRLGPGTIAEYRFAGDANSPIEFIQEKSDERVQYTFEILDESETVLFDERLYAYRGKQFVFTPQTSGTFILRLTGVRDYGAIYLKTGKGD
ncbi:hypothetical protein [Thalassotalea litorea]|uniref:hypothetical protein n=1 Tax=Thalassotalea litorea TaxID=2020715 RepID=UPI003736D397